MSGTRTLEAHGLAVTLPGGWDGSITRAAGDDAHLDTADVGVLGTSNPVLQAASYALPKVRGDFGGGAVEHMGPTDIFIALVEFDPQAGGTALFSDTAINRPMSPAMFSPRDHHHGSHPTRHGGPGRTRLA